MSNAVFMVFVLKAASLGSRCNREGMSRTRCYADGHGKRKTASGNKCGLSLQEGDGFIIPFKCSQLPFNEGSHSTCSPRNTAFGL